MCPLQKNYTEIMPFSWKCSCCNHLMPLGGEIYDEKQIFKAFEEYIDLEVLEKHPLIKTDNLSHEVLKNLSERDSTGLIVTAEGRCTNPECGCPFELKIWLELELDRKDGSYALFNVSNTVLLAGDMIAVDSIPGFYRGVDIAEGLSNLYLRWWYLKGQIFIICHFIGMRELDFFDAVGLKILKTHNSIMVSNPIHNPFEKIITRKNTSHNFKRAQFSQLIDMYLCELSEDRIFLEGQPGSGLLFVFKHNVYEVQNTPKKDLIGEENELQRYVNYFHGKLYGACFNGTAEVVITSYNYTVTESLQLESLAFIITSEVNFHRQIEIFEKDQHMTITPVDLSRY